MEQAVVEELVKKAYSVVSSVKAKKSVDLEDIEEAVSGDYRAVQRKGENLGVDIVIIGRASTRFSGNPMWGVALCHARATVKAIDVRSGEVVTTKDVSEVKGFANNVEKAGIEALKEASRKIVVELVEQLKTSL